MYAAEEKGEDKVAATKVPVAFLADAQRSLVLMLAPFAPYLAHELWETLGEKSSLLRAPWPKYDAALAKEDEVELAVQINGKVRSRIVVPADSSKEHVEEAALADDKVRVAISGKQIVQIRVIPDRLVNVVVK
jgi:leucyl-tRNA synthetase